MSVAAAVATSTSWCVRNLSAPGGPGDRRIKRVSLTESGRSLVSRHLEDKRDELRAFAGRFDQPDRRRLLEAFNRYSRAMPCGPEVRNSVHDDANSTAGPQPGAPESDKIDGAVLKIASVVVLGAIMSILDVTVRQCRAADVAETFETSYAVVAWTMTAYTLAPRP